MLFSKYEILSAINSNRYFEISSSVINEFREARLMTKFDNKANLPKLFKENHLAILPITRGSYVIGRFIAYENILPINSPVRKVTIPGNVETINFNNIPSESLAINCAYISGILSDFLGDEGIVPTINGRMSSESFFFSIQNRSGVQTNLQVENSQIEIDGGYESKRQFCLIEAKNYLSNDFLVRQLYYPFRLWAKKLSKPVRSVFLVYSNSIFSLYEYSFQDIESYNSIKLIRQANYSLESSAITLRDIVAILNDTAIVPEPDVPFPQANIFPRIINLCELLTQGSMSRDEITLNYAFTSRQTNYYTDAGRYLGLIEKGYIDTEISFCLSADGRRIMDLPYRQKQLSFVEKIVSHKTFNEALRYYINRGTPPSSDEVVNIMETTSDYAEDTERRRASTVRSWINWIINLADR